MAAAWPTRPAADLTQAVFFFARCFCSYQRYTVRPWAGLPARSDMQTGSARPSTTRPTPPRPDQPVPCCFCTDLPHRSQRPLTPAFWSSNPGRSRLYRSDRPRIRMPFYYQQTGQYRHHPVVCACSVWSAAFHDLSVLTFHLSAFTFRFSVLHFNFQLSGFRFQVLGFMFQLSAFRLSAVCTAHADSFQFSILSLCFLRVFCSR